MSACLLGSNVKYNGGNNENQKVLALADHYFFVPVCPEQLGGLPTPRPAVEIRGGDGHAVLRHCATVCTAGGEDRSPAFIRGARETLKLAKISGAAAALLKARSPSCGSGEIYDGLFHGVTKNGDGATAALLKQNGILVFHEGQLTDLCESVTSW